MEDGRAGPGDRDAEIDRLAAAARSGEPRDVNAFLRAVEGQVVRYCRSKLPTSGPHTAHDVAQDVLYALCDALPRYEPNGGSVMAFVLGIARFKIVDAFRAGGRDRSVPVEAVPDRPDLTAGPELAAVLSTETDRLRAALAQLGEYQREVVVLRVGLGYSGEEVARLLGSSAGAVRVTQHRALTRLRALLADPVDDGEGPAGVDGRERGSPSG